MLEKKANYIQKNTKPNIIGKQMNIIIMGLKLLTILGLTGCKPNPANQTVEQVTINKEVYTFYSKAENIIHSAKVLTVDSKNFDLVFYDIDISTPEGAKQKYLSTEQLTDQQLNGKRIELQKIYNWTPTKGRDILFVQIQPAGFKTEMELLNIRQKIELKLTSALENSGIGEWSASDLGPGGGNILFEVTNMDSALKSILQVLKQNNLDNRVLIGRRVLISNEDWFYEVIFPTKYSGDFNTM
jgi:hypothetical protein